MKTLQPSEAKALYARLLSSIDPRDVFLQILFETGCRVSESLALTSLHLVGGSLSVPPLKGSSHRQIALSLNLQAKLRRLPAPGLWSEALGAPQSTRASRRRGLDRHFKATLTSLGLRPTNLHTLRHTALSALYAETQDLMLVKAWAGHRSISSTVIYVHLDAQARADRAHQSLLKRLAPGAD